MASAYTQAQIQAFVDLIKLPSKYDLANDPPRDLAFLSDLHTHMVSSAPCEKLDLHYYAKDRSISLDPQDLYQKIMVDGRGRGGYCMELSLFYDHILRGLGFDIYTAGVKIRRREEGVPQGDFIGCHLQHRHSRHPHRRHPDNEIWIYEYRNSTTASWAPFYAFYDIESTKADLGVMNWFTGCSPLSPHLANVLIIKFLRRPKVNGLGQEVCGKRMLVNGTVKENLGGKTEVVRLCRTEEERAEPMQKWFDIRLTKEQQRGIRGWKTELQSTGDNTDV